MPIRIYLDTQDYHRLYKNRDAQHQEIYEYLCDKVDQGLIEIGFSYIIVGEFLQEYKDLSFKADRLERIKVIKRLCNKNAFLFIARLVNSTDPFSYEGDWIPDIKFVENLKNTLIESLKDDLSNYNRQIRRKLKNPSFIKKYIRSNPQIYNSVLKQEDVDFPLPESFKNSNIFIRYLCGEISGEYISRQVKEIVFDLDKFIDAWFEYSDKKNFLYDNILSSGTGFTKMISILTESLEKMAKIKADIKQNEKEAKALQLPFILQAEKDDINNKIKLFQDLDVNYVKSFISNEVLDKFPPAFIETVIAYARASIKTKRKATPSDAGDLMHAAYLPYCDLWRTDVSFSNILIDQRVQGYEKIVPKLLDLPERIEALLKPNKFF